MMTMSDQTALVTGGSRGIGAGIVVSLVEAGFKVIIADVIQPEYYDEYAHHFSAGSLSYIRADIGSREDRGGILEFCRGRTEQLSLLVNNAGISVKKRQDMLLGEESSLDHLLNINLKGPYFLTQSIAKWMIEQKDKYDQEQMPRIINIASLTSYASATYMAEYALSKSAVSMMTKLYADRLSEYGINVYEIRPGIIRINMTKPSEQKYDQFNEAGGLPIKRWGLPADIGKAVVGIATGMLPYSTGEVINIDGGFHLRRL